MGMSFLHRVLSLCLIALLTGCAALVRTPTAFSVYDLGRIDAAAKAPQAIVPAAVEVRSPSWLATSAMQYRLDYLTPASREAYAESRWAGHPAEMVQRLLTMMLVDGAESAGSCRLRIELDEFVQTFETAEASQVEVVARALLVGARDETVLARRVFAISVPAPAADARGGVQAHRDAVTLLGRDLAAWLDGLNGAHAPDARIGERCRR
jgi:cholesterol transport system auxiliary component